MAALLIDTQVYQLYRFHINAGVMNLLLGGAARETFDFSASMYLQATAIALAIIAVQSVAACSCGATCGAAREIGGLRAHWQWHW